MNIIAVGELLWDCYPGGRQIGGAAGNFIYHATLMGAQARLISAVGNDVAGDDLLAELSRRGIAYHVQRNERYPTGRVEVTLKARGVPEYDIVSPVAWDVIYPDVTLVAAVRETDALYFGSLVQRHLPNQRLLRMLVTLLPPTSKVVVDINLRQGHYTPAVIAFCLRYANFLKLNDEELSLIADMFSLPRDPDGFYQQLHHMGRLDMLIYTCGERGSVLMRNGKRDELPGQLVATVDTVGAGDAFIAVATVLALQNTPLENINQAASKVAAWVCTCTGGMPVLTGGIMGEQSGYPDVHRSGRVR